MISRERQGAFPFYFDSGIELREHQFTIVPTSPITTGYVNIYVNIGDTYSKIDGVDIPLTELRPIPLSGSYKGFKLVAVDCDCVSFKVTYIGK